MDLDKQFKNWQDLVKTYSEKFKDISITLSLQDIEHDKLYTIADNAKSRLDIYTIVCMKYNLNPENYDAYIAHSMDELIQILDYMYENADIFVHGATEDVMDCCEIVSFDSVGDDEWARTLED